MRKFLAWFVPIAFVAAVTFSLYKMITAPRAQPVPDDETHAEFDSVDACMDCHAKDGPMPQPQDHPETKVCMDCH